MKTYSNEEKIEIFKILYPLFKREVYDRRDQILKVASLSTGFFLTLILTVSIIQAFGISLKAYFIPIVLGAILFETVIGYHLHQHKSRHEQAKLMIIDLEEQMGFFKEGIFEVSKSFFPGKWKLRGLDPGYIFYPLVHASLMILLGYALI